MLLTILNYLANFKVGRPSKMLQILDIKSNDQLPAPLSGEGSLDLRACDDLLRDRSLGWEAIEDEAPYLSRIKFGQTNTPKPPVTRVSRTLLYMDHKSWGKLHFYKMNELGISDL